LNRYDGLNRLKKVTDFTGGIFTYTYDQVGNLTRTTLPNNIYTTYDYDNLNLLTRLKPFGTHDSEGELETSTRYEYSYDQNGNRVAVSTGGGKENAEEDGENDEEDSKAVAYSYDPLDQLLTAGGPEGQRAYAYDQVSNRILQETGHGQLSYAYNPVNQLTGITGEKSDVAFSYDPDGNLLLKTVTTDDGETRQTTYQYDGENRLTGVEISRSDELCRIEYDYDGLGNLFSRTVTVREKGDENEGSVSDSAYELDAEDDGESVTETVYFVHDAAGILSQILQVQDASGQTRATYVYGLDRLAQVDGENRAEYFLYDGLGSVIALSDHKGEVTARYDYDEFGNPLGGKRFGLKPDATIFGFTGELWDEEAGLLYLRSRHYDPQTGRFLTKDPYPGGLDNPLSLHPYLYCGNNPVIYIDPLGLWFGDRDKHRAVQNYVANEIFKGSAWIEYPIEGAGHWGKIGYADIVYEKDGTKFIWEVKPDKPWWHIRGYKQLKKYVEKAGGKRGFSLGAFEVPYGNKKLVVREIAKYHGMLFYSEKCEQRKKEWDYETDPYFMPIFEFAPGFAPRFVPVRPLPVPI